MKHINRTACLSLLLTVLAFVSAVVALPLLEADMLWKAQELNLHLDTALFFRQQMVVAGGMLTWLGTWLTEFFYRPWLGTAWLAACWVALMVLTARALRVPLRMSALLLVPVALLLLTVVDMGYWLYYLKLRGHIFVATLGCIAAVGAVWLYRVVPLRWGLRHAYMVAATLVLYMLCGFYGLLATAMMAVVSWRLQSTPRRQAAVATLTAVVTVVAVPLLLYRLCYHETNIVNIYWTALPLYRIAAEETRLYYLPYCLLAAYYLVMAAAYGRLLPAAAVPPSGRLRRLWPVGSQVLTVAALGVALSQCWYRDANYHTELRMQRLMEQEDWQGLLAVAAQPKDEPTRAIVMMRNLALFRLGRQGDEQYHYLTGAKDSNAPFMVHMTQVIGRSIYYNYGMVNYCYRWCLEDGVEYGWRAEYLKYMTRCALVNGEWRVARKYLRLLQHTRYHRQWAERQLPLLGHSERVAQDKGYGPVTHMLPPDDRLSSDEALVERFLMYQFVLVKGDDPLYREQSLLAAMWTKDIATFWGCFFPYAQQHIGQRMPIHYQEAAYLYGQLENKVDISGMPFDDGVRQTYAAFMATARQYAGSSEERLRQIMYPQFGHTFYYEYFLIRNQKLY
ncbi:MAG: DUF6057 family protein [Prevotella sp.]|nr:DUF6057 family protein [Prevotella sp.]